jgi:beta-lactamase class A
VLIESPPGQVLAEVGADQERPAASLLKLPLAAAVWEAGLAGELDPAEGVVVGELPQTGHPSVLATLDPERRLTLEEACALCLASSDNPLASQLLGLVGIDAVNRLLERWGCEATRLEVGFSDSELGPEGRRNVSTAREALLLLRKVRDDPRFAPLARGLANSTRNFRIPLRLTEDGIGVHHKTGTLPGVCNDVGVVADGGTELAIAFLCEGEEDTAACSLEIGDCVEEVWASLSAKPAAGDQADGAA